ncbi:hypothetical protein ACFFF6_19900, partial [Brachybacterium hainanense]
APQQAAAPTVSQAADDGWGQVAVPGGGMQQSPAPARQHPAAAAEAPSGPAPQPASAPDTAPAPEPAPAADPGPAAEGSISADAVRGHWSAIMDELQQIRRPVWALVSQNGHVQEVRGSTLVIGFRTAGLLSAFHRGANVDNLAEAVRRVTHLALAIEAVVGEDPGPGGAPGNGSSGIPGPGPGTPGGGTGGAGPAGGAGSAGAGPAGAASPPAAAPAGAPEPRPAGSREQTREQGGWRERVAAASAPRVDRAPQQDHAPEPDFAPEPDDPYPPDPYDDMQQGSPQALHQPQPTPRPQPAPTPATAPAPGPVASAAVPSPVPSAPSAPAGEPPVVDDVRRDAVPDGEPRTHGQAALRRAIAEDRVIRTREIAPGPRTSDSPSAGPRTPDPAPERRAAPAPSAPSDGDASAPSAPAASSAPAPVAPPPGDPSSPDPSPAEPPAPAPVREEPLDLEPIHDFGTSGADVSFPPVAAPPAAPADDGWNVVAVPGSAGASVAAPAVTAPAPVPAA